MRKGKPEVTPEWRYGITDNGCPSHEPQTPSSKAPAWPVSLRDRYGSITLAEVVRFHLIRWDTRRNLRRCRKRQGKRASWAGTVRRNLPGVIAFGWARPATATTPTPTPSRPSSMLVAHTYVPEHLQARLGRRRPARSGGSQGVVRGPSSG